MNTHDREASLSKLEDSTLMLFGTVPIKDVQTGQISRPKLVPCGQPFGIKLVTEGVMVIDLERFEGCCPASECGIKKAM